MQRQWQQQRQRQRQKQRPRQKQKQKQRRQQEHVQRFGSAALEAQRWKRSTCAGAWPRGGSRISAGGGRSFSLPAPPPEALLVLDDVMRASARALREASRFVRLVSGIVRLRPSTSEGYEENI